MGQGLLNPHHCTSDKGERPYGSQQFGVSPVACFVFIPCRVENGERQRKCADSYVHGHKVIHLRQRGLNGRFS